MRKDSALVPIFVALLIIAAALRFSSFAQARDGGAQLALVGAGFGAPATLGTAAPPVAVLAAQRLVRISQLDPAQYVSAAQYDAWNNAACAAGALTMVLDAYGQHLIIGQVIPLFGSFISANGGLLDDQGFVYAAEQAHFGVSLSHSRTLAQVIAIANSGLPVIVGVRSPDLFPAGHFMVVLGGNAQVMRFAESSSANIQWMARDRFTAMWEGQSAVIAPPGVLAGRSEAGG
jgi:hypothetical protein